VYIQIASSNVCSLKCPPCIASKSIKVVKFMTLENLKKYLNKFLESTKLTNVNLTPIDGEFFLNPEHYQILSYLEENREISQYSILTNLVNVSDKSMLLLLNSEKAHLQISIYGHNQELFKINTRTNKFDKFIKRLNLMQHIIEKNKFRGPKITFYFRYEKFFNIPTRCRIFQIIRYLQLSYKKEIIIDNEAVRKNHNWGDQFSNVPHIKTAEPKVGICLYAVVQNVIFPNGDISMCGMVDFNKKIIIGNIVRDSFEQIYGERSIYRDKIENQSMGIFDNLCMKCNCYKYYEFEKLQIENHKKFSSCLAWL